MKENLGLLAIVILSVVAVAVAQAKPPLTDSDVLLRRKFDLAGDRSREIQFYKMESKLVMHKQNGANLKTEVYRLWLRWVPARSPESGGDNLTCLRFTVQLGAAPEAAIPSLKDWSYEFANQAKDEKGQIFGIPHKPFEGLVDESGKNLPLENTYHVYNAFVDFLSFFLLTKKTEEGSGIQDLTTLGQTIVHAASHTTPPTNLGSSVAEGSFFRNGEITLEMKGLGLVQGKACAIVGYDSGESSFTMIMKPTPALEMRTEGSSHYWGDIYKSLDSNWVQKATLHEMVVSETTVPAVPQKIHGIIDRSIILLNVREDELRLPNP
ncbi:MAG TPA: hypothetical protein VE398_20785 [Acidobacteriota bacterium]|nr:hypothetical protein [Acidobacteriota bacterium]